MVFTAGCAQPLRCSVLMQVAGVRCPVLPWAPGWMADDLGTGDVTPTCVGVSGVPESPRECRCECPSCGVSAVSLRAPPAGYQGPIGTAGLCYSPGLSVTASAVRRRPFLSRGQRHSPSLCLPPPSFLLSHISVSCLCLRPLLSLSAVPTSRIVTFSSWRASGVSSCWPRARVGVSVSSSSLHCCLKYLSSGDPSC